MTNPIPDHEQAVAETKKLSGQFIGLNISQAHDLAVSLGLEARVIDGPFDWDLRGRRMNLELINDHVARAWAG